MRRCRPGRSARSPPRRCARSRPRAGRRRTANRRATCVRIYLSGETNHENFSLVAAGPCVGVRRGWALGRAQGYRLSRTSLTAAVHAGQPVQMTLLHDPIEFFDVDRIQDPYPLYDLLRAAGPVHRIGDSGFYVVCDWAAIDDVINRPEDFSSNLTATMMFTAEGTVVPFELDGLGGPTQILATADDPAHAVHRKMLVPQLAAKRIRLMETFIAETFEQLWADGLRDGRIEWMGAFANKLPMMVVAKLIGVSAEDVDQLIAWSCASTQLLDGLVDEQRLTASGVAAMELGNYIHGQFI